MPRRRRRRRCQPAAGRVLHRAQLQRHRFRQQRVAVVVFIPCGCAEAGTAAGAGAAAAAGAVRCAAVSGTHRQRRPCAVQVPPQEGVPWRRPRRGRRGDAVVVRRWHRRIGGWRRPPRHRRRNGHGGGQRRRPRRRARRCRCHRVRWHKHSGRCGCHGQGVRHGNGPPATGGRRGRRGWRRRVCRRRHDTNQAPPLQHLCHGCPRGRQPRLHAHVNG